MSHPIRERFAGHYATIIALPETVRLLYGTHAGEWCLAIMDRADPLDEQLAAVENLVSSFQETHSGVSDHVEKIRRLREDAADMTATVTRWVNQQVQA